MNNNNTQQKWNTKYALKIAKKENIIMTENHWEIIYLIRKIYFKYNINPTNRILLKIIKKEIGNNKSNNLYLLSLFPHGIIKQANKIAGLPTSTICL
ncbi:TusE/DsrC/DsvC family sulfur relay protein [Buchnera aphidicola]|uniref:Sulfurtransferase n=1 Tax=Buchnera aphidicola (Stegophylla sp.) TaxID=2315800 RepID=A0A4D6YEL0_9GAMM|nr:TusE/DsrC/DsvC family sulfur relay protein [Buchnera aphidicola (Stegophylla sp.)]QCI26443.1 TusE/DsrC/DsvC family sulfur relay protein [Buchnera aphidicola (Stegophylla sp.)]